MHQNFGVPYYQYFYAVIISEVLYPLACLMTIYEEEEGDGKR